MLKGVAASPGIEIGKAHVIKAQQININTKKISQDEVDNEIGKLDAAIAASKEQLANIKAKAEKNIGADKAEIFGAHLMVLEDPVFLEEIQTKIKEELVTADNAVSQVVDNYVQIFSNMEDEYMKERAADIKDVGERIIKNVLGIVPDSLTFSEEVIIIAKDLTPSDTAQMDKDKVLAFATDMGGRTSHTAIMARSLEIPAVVGLVDATDKVQEGDTVIVDGNKGVVYINPEESILKEYEVLRDQYIQYRKKLKELKEIGRAHV